MAEYNGGVLVDENGNKYYPIASGLWRKEGNYGDQFAIAFDFGNTDDNNKMLFQGAVGASGEHPSLVNLMTLSGKSGNLWVKGNITAPNLYGKASLCSKLENINGRITNANVAHSYENNKAHLQLLLATSTMTSNKPAADGYILHGSWDNSGQYNCQVYFPNSNVNVPLQFRGCTNGTWGSWENLYRAKVIYNNGSGTYGTFTLSESAANFTILEIYFFVNGSHDVVRVYSPDGKTVSLLTDGERGATNYNFYCVGTIKISGTQVTWAKNQFIQASTTEAAGKVQQNNDWYAIKVDTVVGYR